MSASACPCGRPVAYSDCCNPYIAGQKIAPTAEALMRSRYSAYAKGNVDYLIATHHPSQRQPDARLSLGQSVRATTWLGLKILETR